MEHAADCQNRRDTPADWLRTSRVLVMDPENTDPRHFVLEQGQLSELGGNFNFNLVPGTPASGTTVLRLEELTNPKPIDSLKLTVLHSFFE
jgi:hypothetical protein